MSNVTKKAILRAMVEGVITDLLVKTQVDNVFLEDGTTLVDKLAELVTAVNLRAKSADVTTEIQAAIAALIDGAPETYDTLKEIATYIGQNQSAVDALNAAIGAKADKTVVEALQSTISALGALATKSKVSEGDLDTALAGKISAATSANHSHSNKATLDGIGSAQVTEWNSKSTVFVSPTQPADLAAGDLWFQTES